MPSVDTAIAPPYRSVTMMTAPKLEWLHDLDAALQQAKSANKLVLLDIFNPG